MYGTWSKQGFTALYGVVVVASWDTGKVLNVELKSKFCSVCSACREIDETSRVHGLVGGASVRVWMQLRRFFIRDGV